MLKGLFWTRGEITGEWGEGAEVNVFCRPKRERKVDQQCLRAEKDLGRRAQTED